MTYTPKEYWIEQGKVYKKNFDYNKKFQVQEQILIDYLRKNIFSEYSHTSPINILELGCGFGRITKLILSNFPSIKEYVAVDISPDQVSNAKEYVKLNDLAKNIEVKFIVSDIQSLDLDKNNYYDLVLSCEMLLHILPTEIKEVIIKMVNLSKKHILNVDWYETNPKKKAPHNFVHQYPEMYRSISSIKEVNQVPITKKGFLSNLDVKQSIFHAAKADSYI